jgi:hypothetical protein
MSINKDKVPPIQVYMSYKFQSENAANAPNTKHLEKKKTLAFYKIYTQITSYDIGCSESSTLNGFE